MEELVEKAKSGDNYAFTQLVSSIEKDLYYVTRSKINNENDIEDILQETMIIAFFNIKKLKNNNLFKTWIIKILINNCNKFYKRKIHKSLDEDEEIKKEYGTEMDLTDIEFQDFISFLDKDERTTLTLYYYLGYTTKEISKILGIKEGTICSKISRAKTKIKEKYKGEFC